MSAFLCSDLHILTIAHWWQDVAFTGCQRNPASLGDIADLAARMFNLNDAAVCRRYQRGSKPTPREGGDFIQQPAPPKPDIVQLIKLIDCYLYQCSEGDQFEHTTLYKQLVSARNQISIHYMGKAYDDAEWSI